MVITPAAMELAKFAVITTVLAFALVLTLPAIGDLVRRLFMPDRYEDFWS